MQILSRFFAALKPEIVQKRVLNTAHDLLETAQTAVDERLSETPAKKPAAPVKRAASAKPRSGGRAPIRNYDQLTAKDVVGRIQNLSRPQATALLDYEQSRKNRATVIRAAKQRLAAS